MTIVDTTVWIDFFRNKDSHEVAELTRLIEADEDICICGVIITEVLQGIRDDKEYAKVVKCFDSFLCLPMDQRTFMIAANLYRRLRCEGVTIRNSVDCMIAAVAMEHDIPLLHNDRDFAIIARYSELKVIKAHGGPTPRR